MTFQKHPRIKGKQCSYIEPEIIHQMINDSKEYKKQVKDVEKCYACMERYNPLHYRLKVDAVKNQLIDQFILKFIIKRDIIVNIINKIVKDYWKKNPVFINDYQTWLYFNYTGVDKFSYSKIARAFYVDTGVPPYSIKYRKDNVVV